MLVWVWLAVGAASPSVCWVGPAPEGSVQALNRQVRSAQIRPCIGCGAGPCLRLDPGRLRLDHRRRTFTRALSAAPPDLEAALAELGAETLSVFVESLILEARWAAEVEPEKPQARRRPGRSRRKVQAPRAPARPAKSVPAKSAPAKSAPAKSAPAKSVPAKSAPAQPPEPEPAPKPSPTPRPAPPWPGGGVRASLPEGLGTDRFSLGVTAGVEFRSPGFVSPTVGVDVQRSDWVARARFGVLGRWDWEDRPLELRSIGLEGGYRPRWALGRHAAVWAEVGMGAELVGWRRSDLTDGSTWGPLGFASAGLGLTHPLGPFELGWGARLWGAPWGVTLRAGIDGPERTVGRWGIRAGLFGRWRP